MTILPPGGRPKQGRDTTHELLRSYGVHDAVALLGVRGYYRDSMGVYGRNDRGIFDDAIFVISPDAFASFNANVDPTKWGINKAIGKPYAKLVPGVHLYKIGWHKLGRPSGHKALVQAAPFTVERREKEDGPATRETGWFGINMHKSWGESTSSEGCQTIHHTQWKGFIHLVEEELRRQDQKTVKYLLIENA